MRKGLFAVLALFIMLCVAMGCNNNDVLMEKNITVITDSTRLRVMSWEGDTSSLVVDKLVNATKWTAGIETGNDWCSISRKAGVPGDTIRIFVTKNMADTMRSSFLRIEAGTTINRYRIRQQARE